MDHLNKTNKDINKNGSKNLINNLADDIQTSKSAIGFNYKDNPYESYSYPKYKNTMDSRIDNFQKYLKNLNDSTTDESLLPEYANSSNNLQIDR